MISRKIKKYELDPEKTLPYFLDHIKCGKTLSEKIFEKVDFTKGSFFTILPCDIELERLFDFKHGGIIPPAPDEKKSNSEELLLGKIITMSHECSSLIFDFLKKKNENLAIVDNYVLDPESPYAQIKNVKMIPFNSEVHFSLNKENSVEEIYETIRKSSQVWHFLAVLTRLKDTVLSILTDEIINQICENVEFVIASAYDGEAYIFWEREAR